MEFNKCPHCKKGLEKIPLRKKKCGFCRKEIYVRTRPKDMKKVLVRKDEINKIEKEWIDYAIKSIRFKKLKEFGVEKRDFIKTYDRLKKSFGTSPLISDVLWGIYNNMLLKTMKEGDQRKMNVIRKMMDEFREAEIKEKIYGSLDPII